MKGPDDFARPRYLSLLLVENALRVLQRPMSLILTVKNQTLWYLADRAVLLRESFLVRGILSLKLPFGAVYGVMMTRGQSERVDCN